MFTAEEKQKVREATDLVALVSETVPLRQRGRDLWGCCPFHHEKSPSFHVIPERGFWKCFSCGKGGDCFDYVMERDHLEFPDAVRMLAERAGIELSDGGETRRSDPGAPRRKRLYEAMEEAVSFYHMQLTRVRSRGPTRRVPTLRAAGSARRRRPVGPWLRAGWRSPRAMARVERLHRPRDGRRQPRRAP